MRLEEKIVVFSQNISHKRLNLYIRIFFGGTVWKYSWTKKEWEPRIMKHYFRVKKDNRM